MKPTIRILLNPTLVITLGVAASLGAVSFLSSAPAMQETSTSRPAMHVVVTSPLEQPGYSAVYEFLGSVQAHRESHAGFDLGGRVVSVVVDEGDVVQRGQLLARLDTARLEAKRGELLARRTRALVQLNLARMSHDRVAPLVESNAATQQEVDDTRAHVDSCSATLAEVDASIQSVDVELQHSLLCSPFDGVVARRRVDEGVVVARGQTIVTLLERTDPEVRIGLTQDMVACVSLGEKYEVIIGKHRFFATLKSIAPVKARRTRCVDVILTLDAELGDIRAGDLAMLELSRYLDQPGFWIPITALSENSRGVWSVYIVADHGGVQAAERRRVEVIHQRSDQAFVFGTLESHDLVVIGGVHKVVPGQLVRISTIADSNTLLTQVP